MAVYYAGTALSTAYYAGTAVSKMYYAGVEVFSSGPPAPAPPYLDTAVGTATTPDPGVLPNLCTFVFKVQGPTTNPGAVCGQWEGQYAFQIRRNNPPSKVQTMCLSPATAGSGATYRAVDGATPTGAPETLALSLTIDNGSGNQVVQTWANTAGSWSQVANATNPTTACSDVTTVMRIGGPAPFAWDSRIYWVELRTGLDPAAGTVQWRFDAADHVSGTSWTDARGRTWTLTTPAAIVKPT